MDLRLYCDVRVAKSLRAYLPGNVDRREVKIFRDCQLNVNVVLAQAVSSAWVNCNRRVGLFCYLCCLVVVYYDDCSLTSLDFHRLERYGVNYHR